MFSVFKTLTDQTVIVELKNDLCITGVLKSVDQYVLFGIIAICDPSHIVSRYLNIRLDAIKVQNPDQHPHMVNSLELYSYDVHSLSPGPSLDGCQELLYSRIGRPIRSTASGGYGHPTTRGRHTKRCGTIFIPLMCISNILAP